MARRRRGSRKPSASSRSARPDRLTVFVDRSLQCRSVLEVLRQEGLTVVEHRQLFADDAPDEAWLTMAGRERWIVLHRDSRIRYRSLELQAMREADVRAFVLTGGDMRGTEMAEVIRRHLPRIRRIAETVQPPFLARLSRSRITVRRL